jgi:hypothetical protein
MLLKWHRQSYKLFWRYKSRAMSATPKISAETVAMIKEMARDNRLWGAERIRGERALAGHSCVQTHHSEIHETGTHPQDTRTDVEHVLTFSCPADLGPATFCQ